MKVTHEIVVRDNEGKVCDCDMANLCLFVFRAYEQTGIGFYDRDRFRIIFLSNLNEDMICSDELEDKFSSPSLSELEEKLKTLYEDTNVILLEVFDDYTPLLNLNQFLT